jgi:hypothetical protein
MKGKQGVLRCASHSSASDPLTSNRRKTHPPDHHQSRQGGLTTKRNRPLSGTFLAGAIV